MATPDSPEEFRKQLYSQKQTLHQLRMKLQSLPRQQRAEALLGVFADPDPSGGNFANQELAGRLLVDVQPPCVQPLDDIFRSTVSIWNVSVEQLPFYLSDTFGQEVVIEAATKLKADYPSGSREAEALETVCWWLRGKRRGENQISN